MSEKTFVMIKPDAMGRGLKGEILTMIQDSGFSINRGITRRLTNDEAEFLYDEHSGKSHFKDLVAFTTSGDVFLMEVSGDGAIKGVRNLVGPSDLKAAREKPLTIRGKYAEDHRRNCVHSSDGLEAAARELKFFFEGNG
jgi:nucleoside-diphosphate kinase